MPGERVSMRKIREVLRLRFAQGLSQRAIGSSLRLSTVAVNACLNRARRVGLDWPLPEGLDDHQLEALLYPPPSAVASEQRPVPDWAVVHRELRRPNMTLALLWEESRGGTGAQDGFGYSWFCTLYREWVGRLKPTLRQVHTAGERVFVDFAGHTMEVIDGATGEVRRAEIFVAVLGASSYTFAEASWTQSLPDWIAVHVNMLAFIGGVPRQIVSDNLKSGITRACFYEPLVNRTYADMASHYGTAVIPARPYKPRDKAKVEVGVQVVQRWILARLRNRRFFTLAELNGAIASLLADLNQRPFKKLPGCRRSAFEALDAPALKPLPAMAMVLAQFKPARVNIDYHVAFEGHYYSVPHQHVGAEVELRITATTLEVLLRRQRIAAHARSARVGGFTTVAEHMPASHREHRQWTPAKLIGWGERVGAATAGVVRWQMEHRPHPEQGYRACLGLMRLARQYGDERLEAACARAQSIRAPNYRSVKSILECGLDRQEATLLGGAASPMPSHDNVRGPGYYGHH
jgi:transposase